MRLILLSLLTLVLVSCSEIRQEQVSYSGDQFIKSTTELGRVTKIERCTVYPLGTFTMIDRVVYDCMEIPNMREYQREQAELEESDLSLDEAIEQVRQTLN